MTCEQIAYTGAGIPVGMFFSVAVVLLLLGTVVLLLARRRGRFVAGTLLLLVSATAGSLTMGTPLPASADNCPPVDHRLSIVQTSTMKGLAPGMPPLPITGMVQNNSADSTYVSAIDVKIIGIVIAAGSPPGLCDRSDYVLVHPLMEVAVSLAPGGSTAFSGASIGLLDKPVNQDRCKGATVRLLYTAHPH